MMLLKLSDGRYSYKGFVAVGSAPGLGSLLRIIPSPLNEIRTLWIPRKNRFKDYLHLKEYRKIQDGAHCGLIGLPIEIINLTNED